MKRCPKCVTPKDESEFYNNKTQPDGKETYCKVCKKAQVKVYQKTDNGKVVKARAQRKFHSTEHGRTQKQKWESNWRKTEKGRAYRPWIVLIVGGRFIHDVGEIEIDVLVYRVQVAIYYRGAKPGEVGHTVRAVHPGLEKKRACHQENDEQDQELTPGHAPRLRCTLSFQPFEQS